MGVDDLLQAFTAYSVHKNNVIAILIEKYDNKPAFSMHQHTRYILIVIKETFPVFLLYEECRPQLSFESVI